MMKMLKTLYKSAMVVAIAALSACSSDSLIDREIVPGDSRILLAGAITRGTETSETLDGYTLFLSAKTTEESGKYDDYYFTDVELKVGENYPGVANARYLNADAYYPLGGKKINLFAHTGKLDNNRNITLTAGTGQTHDYLISNGEDGSGKLANSTDKNATELNFRHIMTKVEVVVKVTDDGNKKPVSEPQTVKIELNKVFKSGTYALTTSPASDNASNKADVKVGTALYPLTEGTHYLIPTGEILSGQSGLFKSLIIDDYTATESDRNALFIPKVTPESGKDATEDFVLKPGYSYTLTFEIERLQIRAITVKMNPWIIKDANGDWDYDPYRVKMQVDGGYENTGDKQITKIVLHHEPGELSDTYQYIGSCEREGEVVNAKFLTLPTDMTKGTLTADLYTKDGLLIDGHKIVYNATAAAGKPQFTVSLNANGMTKDDVDNYYEVKTPLQFYYLMQTPEAATYKLMNNIDFNSLALETLPQKDFPKDAELDGDGYSLLHLNLKSSGLFKQNNGTLKHLHIAFSNLDASGSTDTSVGGFCSVNAGTIEACINEADIKAKDTHTIGGICGKNNTTGTIIACLNTGNIPMGKFIGGICGENASDAAGAITACINAGMLHESSNHKIDTNLGGICGLQSAEKKGDAVINSCYWLTGSARPQQGVSQEKAIGSIAKDAQVDYCKNTTNMTETLLRKEAVQKLNDALTTKSSPWRFKYESNNTGTYKTVWPIPVTNTPSNP